MPLGFRSLAIAVALVATGCGGGVQRAALSTDAVTIKASPPLAEESQVPRFAVRPSSSRLTVIGTATFSGEHEFTFRRWNATLVGDPPTQLRLEADATTVEAETPFAEDLIREDLLEVNRFSRCTIEADLERVPGGASDERLVVGNATVHGITRGIRFKATLARRGPSWALAATFDMSRKAFDVRLHNRWESFLHDDFRVELDLRGLPETSAPAIAEDYAAGGR